jgi:cholesterol oxidase
VSRDLARGFGSARASAAMLPMLTMGRDVAGGVMSLQGEQLELDWDPAAGSREYFDRADETASNVARALGGRLARRGVRKGARVIAVHPLGGCPMAANPDDGVVDTDGQVFGCPGLFVADGSVMPGPVGPNPSLTIAAIADHVAQKASERLCGRSTTRRGAPAGGGGEPGG